MQLCQNKSDHEQHQLALLYLQGSFYHPCLVINAADKCRGSYCIQLMCALIPV